MSVAKLRVRRSTHLRQVALLWAEWRLRKELKMLISTLQGCDWRGIMRYRLGRGRGEGLVRANENWQSVVVQSSATRSMRTIARSPSSTANYARQPRRLGPNDDDEGSSVIYELEARRLDCQQPPDVPYNQTVTDHTQYTVRCSEYRLTIAMTGSSAPPQCRSRSAKHTVRSHRVKGRNVWNCMKMYENFSDQ